MDLRPEIGFRAQRPALGAQPGLDLVPKLVRVARAVGARAGEVGPEDEDVNKNGSKNALV